MRDLIGEDLIPSWRWRLLELLIQHGYTTPGKIGAAGDLELMAIPGIGRRQVIHLRQRLDQTRANRGRLGPAGQRLAALIEQAMHRKP